MKARGWLVTGCLAVGIVYAARGGCLNAGQAPDEKLAGHFVDLCDIARGNIQSPERGVKKMGRYLISHAERMTGSFGAMLSEIERIPDDDRHDARARLARERIQAPLRACQRDWERFANAVERDPAANAALQRGLDRLGRTLEIIFSSQPTKSSTATVSESAPTRTLDVRELPRVLADAIAR